MVIIRPIRLTDLDALLELSQLTGFGLTTLPHDADLLKERILDSQAAFQRMSMRPRGEVYLFVMEDLARHAVIGTCGIASKVGGFEPFYAYRLETLVHQSETLSIRKEIQTLNLVTEHNGPCEIGSLFLRPDYRREGNGRLLSLSRFLFIAEHAPRFDPTVIAEMRGVIDDHGRSPFWDAIGRHFFEIEFPRADRLSMIDKKFIADLMPKHPIYVPLLPPEAQDVIGEVHPDTRPALDMLKQEGFEISGMVDIFEAGPVVIAPRDSIRTIRESRHTIIMQIAPTSPTAEKMHLLNPRPDSRACRAPVEVLPDKTLRIDPATAEALELKVNDPVRFAPTHGKPLEKGLP